LTSAPLLLVIDDGTLSRGDFISKMEQEGFRITAATGGQEGIALSQQAEPSAILVSPDIPDLSRDAVLRVLTRSQPAPVIALSSSDDESEAVLALEMGAVDVLTRPWRTRESAARIWAAVGAAPRPHVGAGAGAGVGGGVSEGATEPSATHPDSLLAAGPVELNLVRREVRIRGI
jgi:DNA-binding response OmpR family regulator